MSGPATNTIRELEESSFHSRLYEGTQFDPRSPTTKRLNYLWEWPEKEKVRRIGASHLGGGSKYDLRSAYPANHIINKVTTIEPSQTQNGSLILESEPSWATSFIQVVVIEPWYSLTHEVTKNPLFRELSRIHFSLTQRVINNSLFQVLYRAYQRTGRRNYVFIVACSPFFRYAFEAAISRPVSNDFIQLLFKSLFYFIMTHLFLSYGMTIFIASTFLKGLSEYSPSYIHNVLEYLCSLAIKQIIVQTLILLASTIGIALLDDTITMIIRTWRRYSPEKALFALFITIRYFLLFWISSFEAICTRAIYYIRSLELLRKRMICIYIIVFMVAAKWYGDGEPPIEVVRKTARPVTYYNGNGARDVSVGM